RLRWQRVPQRSRARSRRSADSAALRERAVAWRARSMRLELTRRGDYAVRAMLALADRDSALPTSGREIALGTGIPVGFVPRVMGDLFSAGLVQSMTGRTGGYALGRAA